MQFSPINVSVPFLVSTCDVEVLKMCLLRAFLVIYLFSVVRGHFDVTNSNHDEEIALLTRRLVEEMNSKDLETHDVVLLTILENEKSRRRLDDLMRSMIEALPKENVVTTPKLNKVIRNERTRKAKLVIIMSDSSHGVLNLLNVSLTTTNH